MNIDTKSLCLGWAGQGGIARLRRIPRIGVITPNARNRAPRRDRSRRRCGGRQIACAPFLRSARAIWPPGDPWSTHTSNSIGAFVREGATRSRARAQCGGGRQSIRALGGVCVNLDISLRHCRDLPAGTVGDVERLPFTDATFDASVCVGAVVNYVRADVAIRELLRVTKAGGLVLLDFECSHGGRASLRLTGTGRSASSNGFMSMRWTRPISIPAAISPGIPRDGAAILGWRRYHTATSIWERIFKVALIPKAAFVIDRAASAVPGLRGLASSVLVACRKI